MDCSYNKDTILNKHKSEIDSIVNWCDELVESCIKDTKNKIDEIYSRMQNTDHEISMAELEWILSDLPIEMIYISERLSKLQISVEAVKLKQLHNDQETIKALKIEDPKITKSMIKEILDLNHADDKILITVYESAISRIERYLSLSKELIMGAKKIWTRRVNTENVNPVAPINELPDYNPEVNS